MVIQLLGGGEWHYRRGLVGGQETREGVWDEEGGWMQEGGGM